MKILYGIQGTGNGHLTRAMELLPYLKREAEVDVLISGLHHDLSIDFPVKYNCQGLGFFFGRNGGIDLPKTVRYLNLIRFMKDVKRLPVEEYDLVISDFEPVTAWACKIKRKYCLGVSHQSSLLSPNVPMPEKVDPIGMWILNNYAPCNKYLGFHFDTYGDNIFTPVLRRQIRVLEPENRGHITVYLPAYSDDVLLKVFNNVSSKKWEVFSKHTKKSFKRGNVSVFPVNGSSFLESMRTCDGVVCGAGFETPAETLFLGKKLAVVPMKGQFEQECNAYALQKMGIPVWHHFEAMKKEELNLWLEAEGKKGLVDYPDNARYVARYIMHHYGKTRALS
jgi:uncharacterized protein (TIGR00661 family)